MASNNTTEQEVLALFPDNFDNEISAEDMRTYVNSVFSDKETKVIKIDSVINLSANNSNIFEGSIVIFWNDYNQNRIGVYISKINQPTTITDLIQISTITGEDVDGSINYTVDFEENLDILDVSDTFTNVMTLTTPLREAGKYEIGFSIEFEFDANKLIHLRSRINSGIWREYAFHITDNQYVQPFDYHKMLDFVEGSHTIEIEMRKEDVSGTFNVLLIQSYFKRIL